MQHACCNLTESRPTPAFDGQTKVSPRDVNLAKSDPSDTKDHLADTPLGDLCNSHAPRIVYKSCLSGCAGECSTRIDDFASNIDEVTTR